MSEYDLPVTASANTSESCHNNGFIYCFVSEERWKQSAKINKNIGCVVGGDVSRDTGLSNLILHQWKNISAAVCEGTTISRL